MKFDVTTPIFFHKTARCPRCGFLIWVSLKELHGKIMFKPDRCPKCGLKIKEVIE